MKVLVNGQERELPDGTTLTDLVRELSLERHPIAVERNRSVVPKDRFAATRLAEGDRIEIVSLVGGG
jgi:thiamine biosynthesis protein ThiS